MGNKMSKIKETIDREEIKRLEMEEIDLNYKDWKITPKLKATYHFPTEPYGFVEVDELVESREEAIQNYNTSKRACEGQGQGLEPKEWNRCVDEYLNTGNLVNGTELYQKMSPNQQDWFQTTKKAFKRIKS